MDFEALKAKFKTAGIHVVRVEQEDGIFPSSKQDPRVVGSLDDYLAALTALKAPIVLVYTQPLEDDDFLYSSSGREAADDEVAEEGEGETPEIDLCKVNPALTAFKEHVVNGDSNPRDSGERRGLTTGAPVVDLRSSWFMQGRLRRNPHVV